MRVRTWATAPPVGGVEIADEGSTVPILRATRPDPGQPVRVQYASTAVEVPVEILSSWCRQVLDMIDSDWNPA